MNPLADPAIRDLRSAIPDGQSHRPLSDREFSLFQRFIHRETGIYLPEAKKALVVSRLGRRLRALGLTTFASYFDLVEADRDGEKTVMLDSICTNETRFFREPLQFEFLDAELLPRWKARGEAGLMPKRIRVWSAACSTGEEPYSLAMLLLTHFPADSGWTIEILASDISTKVLATAREGVWPLARMDEIPPAYLRAYMLRGLGAEKGRMRAGREITSLIEFRSINLNDDRYPVRGAFDLIFCRNVLIYFNRETKSAVIERLATRISRALGEQSQASRRLHEVTSRMSDHIAEINRATREQARGATLMAQESERVRDIAAQVKNATEEQSTAGRGITLALEKIAEDARAMRDLLERQLQETDRIADASRVMLDIATKNDAMAREFNATLMNLVRSGREFESEVTRFRYSGAEQ